MNFLRKFMYGRYGSYGVDHLNRMLLAAYLVLYLLGLIVRWNILVALSGLLAFWVLFRFLSRNIPARQNENARYLRLTSPVRSWFRTRRMIRTDKDHRYFKCPTCGQRLRVPRVGGTVKITCRSCGATFQAKS